MTHYNIYNFLNVMSNIKGLFPSTFITDANNYSDLNISIDKTIIHSLLKQEATEIMPGIYVLKGGSKILAQFKILGITIAILATFHGEQIALQFSPSFYQLSRIILKMPIASLFPLEHFVKLITQILLLKKKYSFIIAAGLMTKSHQSILLSSFGGIGKTTTCLKLFDSAADYSLLGDDTLITDGQKIWSYPKNFRLRKLGNVFFSLEKNISPEQQFPGKKIGGVAWPKYLFLLEKGPANTVQPITAAQASVKFLAIQNKILNLYAERIILASSHQNLLDLPLLMERQKQIVEQLVTQTHNFIVQARQAHDFNRLITNQLINL
ncbi:MAG: hypothetical protein NTX82_02620 [Candidatus Parcubacteria bacterium]|nr:hypothetical protein [Candidatus Parcubacteria bacterium]